MPGFFYLALIPKAPFHYTLCRKDTMNEIQKNFHPFKSVKEWNFIGTHNNRTPLCIYAWMHQKWITHKKTVIFISKKAILVQDSGDMGTQFLWGLFVIGSCFFQWEIIFEIIKICPNLVLFLGKIPFFMSSLTWFITLSLVFVPKLVGTLSRPWLV